MREPIERIKNQEDIFGRGTEVDRYRSLKRVGNKTGCRKKLGFGRANAFAWVKRHAIPKSLPERERGNEWEEMID